jgi:hypothetical protein
VLHRDADQPTQPWKRKKCICRSSKQATNTANSKGKPVCRVSQIHRSWRLKAGCNHYFGAALDNKPSRGKWLHIERRRASQRGRLYGGGTAEEQIHIDDCGKQLLLNGRKANQLFTSANSVARPLHPAAQALFAEPSQNHTDCISPALLLHSTAPYQ